MKVFYREILKKAWDLTKRLKYLWFFGIFAALTANGEEYDLIVRNFDTVAKLDHQIQKLRDLLNQGVFSTVSQNLNSFFTNNIFSSILIVFAGIIIVLAGIYLITISQIAIIKAASLFKKDKKMPFIDGFFLGTRKFWPVFFINLLAKIIIYGLLLIVGIPLAIAYVNSGNFTLLTTISLFAFLVLVPLNVFISFLVRYASIHTVLKGAGVFASIKESWHLFRKNWLITLENALLLYIINFLITFVIVSIATFTQLPFTAAGYIVFMALLIFVGAIIATFRFGVWTYLYLAISKGEGISKIIRIFKSFRSKKEEPEEEPLEN